MAQEGKLVDSIMSKYIELKGKSDNIGWDLLKMFPDSNLIRFCHELNPSSYYQIKFLNRQRPEEMSKPAIK